MFNVTPLYLHDTHLSHIQIPQIVLLKHVDCNQTDGFYNAVFNLSKCFRRGGT